MVSPNSQRDESNLLYHYTSPKNQNKLKFYTDLAEYIGKAGHSFVLLTGKGRACLSAKDTTGFRCFPFPLSIFPSKRGLVSEIPCAILDSRFSDNSFLPEFSSARFFATIPLINHRLELLGYLTLQDEKPNLLDKSQKKALLTLADQLVACFETLRNINALQYQVNTQQKSLSKQVENLTHTRSHLTKFSQATSLSSNAIVFLELDGRISWVNQSFERMFGYKSAEVVGSGDFDFLTGPETNKKDFEKGVNSIMSGKGGNFELALYHKNGTPVWILASLNPILGKDGKIESITSVITDISAIKKADSEIKQLSLVATESPGGVLIRNSKGITTWLNKAFELTSGYSAEELIGKDVTGMFAGPETDLKTHKKAVTTRSTGGKIETELLLYKKDGSPVWIQLFTYPLLNDRGKVESMVTLTTDITERIKKDEEFRMLSLVASKTITGVSINDKNGKVFWCNPSLEKMSGYKLDDLKGKLLGNVMKGRNTDLKELKAVRRIANQKRSFYTELLSYKKDGTPFWLAVSSTPVLDENGRLMHQVDIVDDITERKETELQLVKVKDEALRLSKAKEMFLSVMSHEIRTPLNTVNGITQLLLDDSPPKSQLEYLKLLKFSGENLSTLINDILDLTKMETGNLTLEKTTVNLHELLSNTISSLQVKANETVTKLALAIDTRIPTEIQGDPVRLYQILMNLAGNSIKFTRNGKVKVSLKLIHETKTTVKIGFKIADTGIGIPEDKLEAIFEAYTQASSDTTRKFGGTGLGLTITRNLLKIHGSEIQVSSKVGKGSTFSFDIEFKKVPGHTTILTEQQPLSNLPILVVDDNEINRKIAHRVLSGLYPEIHFAKNGQVAVEKVKTTKYACILMDVFMPVMDGIEATAEIRTLEGPYFKNLPIIALTGSTDESDLQNIRNCGMNGHIVKPLVRKDIEEKLTKIACHNNALTT